MIITLDTNVLVRAAGSPKGPAGAVLELIRTRPEHVLVLSTSILDEVEDVLRRPRLTAVLGLTIKDSEEFLLALQGMSRLVEPEEGPSVVLNDPDDDAILYTAIGGAAGILCSLDRHLLAPDVRRFAAERSLQIMTDIDLLEHLRS